MTAIGLRPISALVDITNYITFDLGRPLHVYDADKVSGNLTMRLAEKDEECLALNEVNYKCTEDMIVISDDNRKLHKHQVPSIGGVIFFLNLILFFIFLLFNNKFLNDYQLKFLNGNKQYFSFFIISSLIFFIGIIDDKLNLSPLKKSVLFLILIIFSNIDENLSIRFLSFEFLNYNIQTNHIGIFFSIMSIFYFMNALNMFDGIDIQTHYIYF